MAANPFRPSDDMLINDYLIPKIRYNRSCPFINEADVYSKPPDQLIDEHAPAPHTSGDGAVWYFFTHLCYTTAENQKRRSRTVVGADGMMGRWHQEKGKRPVSGAVGGGYLTKFSYKFWSPSRSSTSRSERSSAGWVMAEYSYVDGHASDTVLCKVYRSSQHQDSTAGGPGAQPAGSGAPAPRRQASRLEELLRLHQLLMTDDDDAMRSQIDPHGEAAMVDALARSYESCLLGHGGGGRDDGQHETAPATMLAPGAGGNSNYQTAHDYVFSSLAARGYVHEWLATAPSTNGQCSVDLLPYTVRR